MKNIKDLKSKGIKISDDDKAIDEIRDYIQDLKDNGVKVRNFNEMNEEIKNHIQDLKDKGIKIVTDDNHIEDLVNRILKNKGEIDEGVGDKSVEDEGVGDEGVEKILNRFNEAKLISTYKTGKDKGLSIDGKKYIMH